jgi:hypothetical protein
MAIDTIVRIAVAGRDNPTVLSSAGKLLDSVPPHPLAAALSGECAYGIGNLESLRGQKPVSLARFVSDAGLKDDPALWQQVSNASTMTPDQWNDLLDANGIALLDLWRQIVEVSSLPYAQSEAWFQSTEENVTKLTDPNKLLLRIMMPSLETVATRRAQIEARETIARTVFSLLSWKKRYGAFPIALDEALPKPPADPFTGKSLGYRSVGTGFVLYSAGPSLAYDGSASSKNEDVVFRYAGGDAGVWK